jgi:hypothetical protein
MDILGTVGAMSIDFKRQAVYLSADRMLSEAAGVQSYSPGYPGR